MRQELKSLTNMAMLCLAEQKSWFDTNPTEKNIKQKKYG